MKRSSVARQQQHADRRRLVAGRARGPLGDAAERVGRAPRRHPKPPAGSVMSRATLASPRAMTSYLRRLLRDRRRLPARRRGLEGARARAAAALHAPPDARGLRHGRAAADDDHPRLDRPAARARRGVRALPLPRRRPRAPAARSRARRPGTLLVVTTVAALAVAVARRAVCRSCCSAPSSRDVIRAAALGLWAFTNLELAYALLRVEERRAGVRDRVADQRRADRRADGLCSSSCATRARSAYCSATTSASAVVLLGLWWPMRDALGLGRARRRAQLGADAALRRCRPCPPRSSVFALFFVDRALALLASRAPAAAGLYSLAVKLAGVVDLHRARRSSTRGRRWPTRSPTTRRRRASTPASRPTTCCSPGSSSPGWRCSAAGSCGCFAAPEFFAAHEALPWVALGWALYGLFLVLVAMAGRAQVTIAQRARRAARARGQRRRCWSLLVAAARDRRRRASRSCGAYVVMLVVMYALTRNLFPVAFEWGRLALLRASSPAGSPSAGELLLPDRRASRASSRARSRWPRSRSRSCAGALLPARRAARPRAACSGAAVPSAAG